MVLAALFDGPKTDPAFRVDGKRLGFAEAIQDVFKKFPNFFESASQYNLQKWRKICLDSGLKGDHELIAEMNAKLKKIAKPFLVKSEEGRQFRKYFPPIKTAYVMPDNRTLDQPFMTLNEIKGFIEEHSERVEEITLYEADDEILELIREKCPKVFYLKIVSTQDRILQLTSNGLKSISQMSLLEIDFDLKNAPFIAVDGLQNFFSSQIFKKKLKKIKLDCPFRITEVILKEIAQFEELEWLALSKVFSSQYLKFLSSVTLQKSLKVFHFTLAVETAFTEKELKQLALFHQLTSLKLNCMWDNITPKLFDFRNLKEIKLKYINRLIIGQLPVQLEVIEFKECTNLITEDYDLLFIGRLQIKSITLKKCTHFTDKNITLLLPLQLELIHIEESSLFRGLEGLFLQMRNCLRSVTLVDNQTIPSDSFVSIGQIERLHTLVIGKSCKFNQLSLEGVFNERVRNQLKAVSLREVSMVDGMVLTRINHIEALEISNCHALARNLNPILHSVTLQSKLRILMLDGFVIKDDIIRQFDKLEVFYGGNSSLKEVRLKKALVHLYDGDK